LTDVNDVHVQNITYIFVTEDVSKLLRSSVVRDEQL